MAESGVLRHPSQTIGGPVPQKFRAVRRYADPGSRRWSADRLMFRCPAFCRTDIRSVPPPCVLPLALPPKGFQHSPVALRIDSRSDDGRLRGVESVRKGRAQTLFILYCRSERPQTLRHLRDIHAAQRDTKGGVALLLLRHAGEA